MVGLHFSFEILMKAMSVLLGKMCLISQTQNFTSHFQGRTQGSQAKNANRRKIVRVSEGDKVIRLN